VRREIGVLVERQRAILKTKQEASG
jgi:hypothetical protein